MSSNIRISRICLFCKTEFIAKTTTTQYCSHNCSKRAYKVRMRDTKIQNSNQETLNIKFKPIEELKTKEFLSITEASILLGVSQRTLYRLMEKGSLKYGKLGKRTLIKRAELDKIFE